MTMLITKGRSQGQFRDSVEFLVQWILEHPSDSLQICFSNGAEAKRFMADVTRVFEEKAKQCPHLTQERSGGAR